MLKELFEVAKNNNLDTAEFMFALAEMVAATAATLDINGGPLQRFSLDERLETFTAHVRHRHPKIVEEILAIRKQAALVTGTR